jgi:hypothetical protein
VWTAHDPRSRLGGSSTPVPTRFLVAALLGASTLVVPDAAVAAATCQGFAVTQSFTEGPDTIVVATGLEGNLPVLDLLGGSDLARTRDFGPVTTRVGAIVCLGEGDNVFSQHAGVQPATTP